MVLRIIAFGGEILDELSVSLIRRKLISTFSARLANIKVANVMVTSGVVGITL
jgi:hypothetical protein